MSTEYSLQNSWHRARRRMDCMEATYDPGTIRHLTALGVGPGMRCLEVGAGGGSISRWLADRVGPGGEVAAVDIDVRFLSDLPPPVSVHECDVRVDPLPGDGFDLVHVRFLLAHLAERDEVLDRFVAALRPGGWLLVEECDSVSTAAMVPGTPHETMMRHAERVLRQLIDVDIGRALPGMLTSRGLDGIGVDCHVPFAEGGGPEAEWMLLTVGQLHEATGGLADEETFARWEAALREPRTWVPGGAIVSAWGRRAG